jgi:integrase
MPRVSIQKTADFSPSIPTLAQLRERILADQTLPLPRRRDVASALRSLAKALRMPPELLPADPLSLRAALKGLTPAMSGTQPPRWRNMLSLTRFALTHAGLITLAGRFEQTPSARWVTLLAALPILLPLPSGADRPDSARYSLSRFARYCTAAGVEPEQVDDAVLAQFLADLGVRSLVLNPSRVHRDTAVQWNRAAATLPCWPQQRLSVADNRPTYALPWDTFPASLKRDVDAWLDWLGSTDLSIDRDFRPLRPASIKTRTRQMHEYLSALVLQGEDPAQLPDLAAAVTMKRAASGLGFFYDRAGGKPSVHGGQVAGVVLSIARHWAKLPAAEIEAIKRIARRITLHRNGMTERNKVRLRAVDDAGRLQDLLRLPEFIRAEVVRDQPPTQSLALRLQTAVAIELLIMAPVRIKNLAALKVGVHLLPGRRDEMVLTLPEDEVKNGVSFEAGLPAQSVRLVELYLRSYRPLLGPPDPTWLFPGKAADGHKGEAGLRQQIENCIARRCGLRFNPHLFRHFAAKLTLEADPAGHGQVKCFLGHTSINTTIAFYTGMATKASFAHYDALIQRLRGDLPVTPTRKRKRKRPSIGRG